MPVPEDVWFQRKK